MTTIIISPPEVAWVDATVGILRRRGKKVVRLGNLAIIGFLLMSAQIGVVVIHQDCVPADWDAVRDRLLRIAATSRIIVVGPDEPRSPSELATWIEGS